MVPASGYLRARRGSLGSAHFIHFTQSIWLHLIFETSQRPFQCLNSLPLGCARNAEELSIWFLFDDCWRAYLSWSRSPSCWRFPMLRGQSCRLRLSDPWELRASRPKWPDFWMAWRQLPSWWVLDTRGAHLEMMCRPLASIESSMSIPWIRRHQSIWSQPDCWNLKGRQSASVARWPPEYPAESAVYQSSRPVAPFLVDLRFRLPTSRPRPLFYLRRFRNWRRIVNNLFRVRHCKSPWRNGHPDAASSCLIWRDDQSVVRRTGDFCSWPFYSTGYSEISDGHFAACCVVARDFEWRWGRRCGRRLRWDLMQLFEPLSVGYSFIRPCRWIDSVARSCKPYDNFGICGGRRGRRADDLWSCESCCCPSRYHHYSRPRLQAQRLNVSQISNACSPGTVCKRSNA